MLKEYLRNTNPLWFISLIITVTNFSNLFFCYQGLLSIIFVINNFYLKFWPVCLLETVPTNNFATAETKTINLIKLINWANSNGYTKSNPRRIEVDITLIRRRPNFDEFPRHFHILFRCDFAGRKIHVVSTYFFRCNFDGRKIHIVSTYFFRCNFDGRKIHVVFTYFFPRNFDGQRFDIVFGKL